MCACVRANVDRLGPVQRPLATALRKRTMYQHRLSLQLHTHHTHTETENHWSNGRDERQRSLQLQEEVIWRGAIEFLELQLCI